MKKTGYDTTSTKRLPDCLDTWSVQNVSRTAGADAVKFFWLYYDVDSSDELNQQNKPISNVLVLECGRRYSILSEISAYDEKIADAGSQNMLK